MPAKGTKIDPRVRRTQRLIESAFLELLNEKTLHALTVGAVTERAEINRATFYAHYDDKYALFNHVVRKTFIQELRAHISEDAKLSPESLRALVTAVCYYFVYLNSQCPPSDRQLRPLAETAVQAVVYEQLYTWLVDVTPVDNVEVTATFISWAIFGAAQKHTAGSHAVEVDELTATIDGLVKRTMVW